MTSADESIDEQVDALIAGERSSISPRDDAEAARAAGLLVIHGLLREKAQGAALHDERMLLQALNRVRRMPIRVIVRRSLVPLATAALICIGFFAWWSITTEHRAVAGVSAMHQAQGQRRYELVVNRKVDDAGARTLKGTYDVDGRGNFVMTFPIPTESGNRVVFGRSGPEWWIIPPMGTIQRGTGRDLVMNWVRSVAQDAPIPSIDETLERLEADYDVTVARGANGINTYKAERVATEGAGATFFFLTVDSNSGKVNRVRWEWDKPCGSMALVVSMECTLVERRIFPEKWFDAESHLDPKHDLGEAPEEPSR